MAVELTPLAPTEALEFFRSKGLAPEMQRFDWRDHWREEHARAFVVAKAMQDDVLKTIREELDRALAEGRTFEQFKRDLRPKLEAFGWWGTRQMRDPLTGEMREVRLGTPHRLRTIFDTNMRTSLSAGRWARIQRTKRTFPYLEYRQIQRPTKRDAHEPYHGLIRPVDDPVWLAIMPPNGWYCGCSVRQVNDRILKREGKEVSPPFDLTRVPWLNRRTGEIEQVPQGVDPGFDSNPGAVFRDIREAHARITDHLPDAVRAIDRALTEEIRARGLRDADESLAIYDVDTGGVIGWNRSVEGTPDRVRIPDEEAARMRDPDARLVAIHSHPSSSSFSRADLRVLRSSPGLTELVAVGLDGSQFRVRLRRRIGDGLIVQSNRWWQSRLQRAIWGGDIDIDDASALHAHLWMLYMDRKRRVRYRHEVSGRLRDAIARNAGLIDRLLDLAMEEAP